MRRSRSDLPGSAAGLGGTAVSAAAPPTSRRTWPGSTVLAARALSEGTERYDAIQLVEAAERLGASIHAEAGWDATSAGVDVPADRLEPALELVAEMLARPTFPEAEVERLRDERLNDLLQARADPRRRADEAFAQTIYAPESPYHRPSGGTKDTVARLDAGHAAGRLPADASTRRGWTLVVAGDLDRARRAGHRRAAVRMRGSRRADPHDRGRSRPAAPSTGGSSGSSTGRVRSRPRSGSGTPAFRGRSRTSTPWP